MLTSTPLAGQTILVTGGSGFLGSHIVPLLLKAGANVRCLSRSPEAARALPPAVIPVRGDCQNSKDVENAMKGCDLALHMAGLLFGASWRHYLHANSTMAGNIARAAAKNPLLRKIVFISSLAAAGPSALAPGKTEKDEEAPVSAYGWSKLLAERTLKAECASLGHAPRLVILRPPIIYGSGDRGLLPLFRSAKHGIGISPGMRKFPLSVIHARDAAKAILLALVDNSATGIYHLSDGVPYDMSDICRAMGNAMGKRSMVIIKPPLPVMRVAAFSSSLAYNFLRKAKSIFNSPIQRPPAFNMDKFYESSAPGWLSDNTRIVAELGFTPEFNLGKGMEEAVAGYRRMGML